MDETLESSDKIRLLRVLPALSTKEPIICELQWHAVANPPKYRAISYSWGNPAFVYEISVDEKPVKITRSAQDVLQNIRSSWKTEAVWIDAICIDQSSNEDKAQQIPLMPLIYQNAAEVIVWLGPSKRAIPKEAARALKIMLSKQWFERCWVVQEVVAAKKTRVTVHTISRDPALLSMLSERIGYSGLEQATALRNANVVRRFSFLRSEKEPLSDYQAQNQVLYHNLESFNSTAPIPGEKPPKVIALEKAINNKDQLSLMLPNATLNTIPKITFLENDILLLHGRILGPITAVGTIFPRYTPETWILTLHRLADWSALARTHYTPSSPAAQTAIWQTFLTLLIQNRSSTVPLDFTFTNPFTSPDPAMLAPFAQFQLDVILAAGVKASNEEADKAFRAFCEVASMGCTGRCFAVVGACVMGLVGEGVRVGDLVVVVDGCRVPLVLRWVADGLWELVGPAYVQGFMGGEGMGGGFVEMDFRV
ncbi:putative Heterokaryon incompatibility protein 6, OR allele [Glarea lozoyensis 74030]|uniref:Putative Heterokaryon incompatibility protein 6, OR allele n=1 Tax=Glarea lozoyensis (strain ATCC 74030 / MF5533) TaxID=1104152 RepID=H0EJ93_GLAL7|nr:putative Heterokaryon incompatibility protein 6, OR allele [Glarea lozoyensis 74030]